MTASATKRIVEKSTFCFRNVSSERSKAQAETVKHQQVMPGSAAKFARGCSLIDRLEKCFNSEMLPTVKRTVPVSMRSNNPLWQQARGSQCPDDRKSIHLMLGQPTYQRAIWFGAVRFSKTRSKLIQSCNRGEVAQCCAGGSVESWGLAANVERLQVG